VDVLAYFAQKMSGLPHAQVIGSGTFLDTVRLRSALAEQVQVADTAIHAYVLGEHGDSQMVRSSLHSTPNMNNLSIHSRQPGPPQPSVAPQSKISYPLLHRPSPPSQTPQRQKPTP